MTPVLLDISRAISRAPFVIPTGIDRVERAYIEHFLDRGNCWFLSRISGGYVVLDQTDMRRVLLMLSGTVEWQTMDLIARVFGRKKPIETRRAESTLRRQAIGVCGKKGLSKMLARHIPVGFAYVNVGHSNRNAALWESLNTAGVGHKLAMIHDVIPLDYPEYSRIEMVSRFGTELKLTAKNCDTLIYNSKDTARRTQIWLDDWGVKPNSITALLGVAPLPAGYDRKPTQKPYFIVLGTIEPRKNHQLLLDIWQNLWARQNLDVMPHLHIVGRRGWLNDSVFDVLDNSPMIGETVFEHNNMDDTRLSDLLSGARALLFPSFVEGFGYPLIEALQKKIPAICSNLACFHEIAGELPLYLPLDDKQGWENAILDYSQPKIRNIPKIPLDFPSWEQHFLKIDTIF